jgi:hypothetical protein
MIVFIRSITFLRNTRLEKCHRPDFEAQALFANIFKARYGISAGNGGGQHNNLIAAVLLDAARDQGVESYFDTMLADLWSYDCSRKIARPASMLTSCRATRRAMAFDVFKPFDE